MRWDEIHLSNVCCLLLLYVLVSGPAWPWLLLPVEPVHLCIRAVRSYSPAACIMHGPRVTRHDSALRTASTSSTSSTARSSQRTAPHNSKERVWGVPYQEVEMEWSGEESRPRWAAVDSNLLCPVLPAVFLFFSFGVFLEKL